MSMRFFNEKCLKNRMNIARSHLIHYYTEPLDRNTPCRRKNAGLTRRFLAVPLR
jgi:hypothetical protein